MQRYFVKGTPSNIIFSENDIFHMTKVMRFRINDKIEVVMDEKLYLCEIINLNPIEVKILLEVDEKRELNNDVTLIYCLPKGDKLDLVIQKATELGVSRIIGVISSRTIVHLKEEDIPKKIVRYQRIIKEACEQSKRLKEPKFENIIPFKELDNFSFDHKFIAYEDEAIHGKSLYSFLENVNSSESIAILVGPEGGFSSDEVQECQKIGYEAISLGKRILRSETAAIMACGIISFMLER